MEAASVLSSWLFLCGVGIRCGEVVEVMGAVPVMLLPTLLVKCH